MKVMGYDLVPKQVNAVIDRINESDFTVEELENELRNNNVERPPYKKYNEDLVFHRAAKLIVRNLQMHGIVRWDAVREIFITQYHVERIVDDKEPQFMTLNDYQDFCAMTDLGNELYYYGLKLAGESGEVAEKIGKLYRGDYEDIDPAEFRRQLALELGDVLWYISAVASQIDHTLEDVANMNIEKLADRSARGKLKGSGDDR